jgi:hypothetical protein
LSMVVFVNGFDTWWLKTSIFLYGFRINTNDSETAGPATQETMLKFPEYFDNDSTKEKCSQSLSLVLVPEAKGGEKPTECNEEIVLE